MIYNISVGIIKCVGFIIIIVIGFDCNGQTIRSDLEISSHFINYEGNEELLYKLTEPLRKSHPHIVGERDQICEQLIKEVGYTNEPNYFIVYISSSIGISCRGTLKTLVFKNEKLIGYWRSDVLFPKFVMGTQIIWQTEGGTEYIMDVKNQIPNEFKISNWYELTFHIIE